VCMCMLVSVHVNDSYCVCPCVCVHVCVCLCGGHDMHILFESPSVRSACRYACVCVGVELDGGPDSAQACKAKDIELSFGEQLHFSKQIAAGLGYMAAKVCVRLLALIPPPLPTPLPTQIHTHTHTNLCLR
jgi:hypothetical protein